LGDAFQPAYPRPIVGGLDQPTHCTRGQGEEQLTKPLAHLERRGRVAPLRRAYGMTVPSLNVRDALAEAGEPLPTAARQLLMV
jgi:hypothetical protein